MSIIANVKSVVPATFLDDTEVAALTGFSTIDNDAISIDAPRVLNYLSMVGAWGYYFAVIEDGHGFSRTIELQNATDMGGVASSDLHLAAWSPDPHSDDWRPLVFQGTVGNRHTFSNSLPNRGRFAVTRVPGYTVTRVYRKTAEYRTHPYVLPTPSAPDGNYGVQVSPPDWRGLPVPDLPLPAYRIGDGVQEGKNIVVLTAGNHPYEVHADYNLEGSVSFLLSEDPIAQQLRQWCDIFVYPTINPAGRWAGYSRANPELKAAGQHDHNRIWGQNNRDTVVKLKAAFQADFGSSCAVLIDYHTFYFDETSKQRGIWAPNEVSNSLYMTRYGQREPDDFNNRFVGSTSTIQTLPEYAIASLGAIIAVHSEETALASRNVAQYRISGQSLMLALWDMISDGLMAHGPA